MDSIIFLRAFLKNWREVGSPFQTSNHAARKVCDFIDFQKAKTIVEIGPGLGNLTRELLKRLAPDSRLILFEINEDLCAHLRVEDPRVAVFNRSGFDIDSVLDKEADCVISEIPIATMSPSALAGFYSAVKRVLRAGGSCIQLQLSLISHRELKRLFRDVEVFFTFLNVPPIFIYRCSD